MMPLVADLARSMSTTTPLSLAVVPERKTYSDTASGKKDDRPGLDARLKALRTGDMLVIWKLDWLGRKSATPMSIRARSPESPPFARGHNGGRKPKMAPAKLRLAQAAMGKRGTVGPDPCDKLHRHSHKR
jgi:hypothetical protein